MMNKKPNYVMNTVYDILEEHEIGIDLYDTDTVQEIIDFLDGEDVRYTYASEDFHDMSGYFSVFTWADEEKPNDCPRLVMFEVQY